MQKIFMIILMLVLCVNTVIAKGSKDDDKQGGNTGNKSSEKTNIQNRQNNSGTETGNRNKNIDDSKSLHTENNRIIFKDSLDQTSAVQKTIRLLIKELKKNNNDNLLATENTELKDKINSLSSTSALLESKLNDDQKKLIKLQLTEINIICSNLIKLTSEYEADFNKESRSKEKLSLKIKEIETEINKADRKIRAAEWILFEK